MPSIDLTITHNFFSQKIYRNIIIERRVIKVLLFFQAISLSRPVKGEKRIKEVNNKYRRECVLSYSKNNRTIYTIYLWPKSAG